MKRQIESIKTPQQVLAVTTLMVLSLILLVGVVLLAQQPARQDSEPLVNPELPAGPNLNRKMSAENIALLINAIESDCSLILLLPREGRVALAPDCRVSESSDELGQPYLRILTYPYLQDFAFTIYEFSRHIIENPNQTDQVFHGEKVEHRLTVSA